MDRFFLASVADNNKQVFQSAQPLHVFYLNTRIRLTETSGRLLPPQATEDTALIKRHLEYLLFPLQKTCHEHFHIGTNLVPLKKSGTLKDK